MAQQTTQTQTEIRRNRQLSLRDALLLVTYLSIIGAFARYIYSPQYDWLALFGIEATCGLMFVHVFFFRQRSKKHD